MGVVGVLGNMKGIASAQKFAWTGKAAEYISG